MGDFASFSVVLPKEFQSGIKGFTLEATSTDGWLISSLSIQIGDKASKSFSLSDEGGIWLDGENDNHEYLCEWFPYHNIIWTWTFDDLNGFPTKGKMSYTPVPANFERDSA
jgi:hypothetical protein